jgi:transcriptional regulator with XRE-family HTH domain
MEKRFSELNKEDIARRIKEIMKENEYNERRLAEELSVTPAAVSRWLSAKAQPDVDSVSHMAELFGVDMQWIYKGYVTTRFRKIENGKWKITHDYKMDDLVIEIEKGIDDKAKALRLALYARLLSK